MADVITRFKLETTQFDSKLRDESRRLTDLTKHLQLAGNDFNKFAANSVESARALGQLSTGTDNAAQSLKVLVKAYNDVANAYNALTEEQKKGDFGKAMAESLQQLQGRITQTKNELNSTGGVLSQLADKFVVNIDAIKLFNVGLAAVKGALNVAKDAFFASEQNLDEWGRIVDSSESIYKGFLNALNTGDISGYLTNIGNIERAARAAYDALDELNTFNAFNQINVEKTRTAMTEAIVDYRDGNGSKESVRAAGDAYKRELAARMKLERENYDKAIANLALQRGVSEQDLRDVLSGTYGDYKTIKSIPLTGRKRNAQWKGLGTPLSEQYTERNVAANKQERLAQAMRNINDTELQSLQAIGAQAERTANEIAQVDRQLVRVLNGRQGGAGGGTGGSVGGSKEVTIQQQIAALEREALTATAKRQDEIRATIHLLDQELARQKEIVATMHGGSSDPVSDFWKAVDRGDPNASFGIPISTKVPEGIVKPGDLKNWEDYYAAIEKPLSPLREMEAEAARLKEAMADAASPEQYQQLNAELSAVVEKMSKFKGENVVKAGEDATESWRAAASAIQSVGSALSNIEDPIVKIVAIVAEAVANVALSFSKALMNNTKFGVFGWIAAAAAGTATMLSTIAAIKSATAGSYAEGGIVPGRSFTGDNLTANVNSGELILTAAQQNNIASLLSGGSQQGGGTTTATVSSENIRIAIRNGARARGLTVNEYINL